MSVGRFWEFGTLGKACMQNRMGVGSWGHIVATGLGVLASPQPNCKLCWCLCTRGRDFLRTGGFPHPLRGPTFLGFQQHFRLRQKRRKPHQLDPPPRGGGRGLTDPPTLHLPQVLNEWGESGLPPPSGGPDPPPCAHLIPCPCLSLHLNRSIFPPSLSSWRSAARATYLPACPPPPSSPKPFSPLNPPPPIRVLSVLPYVNPAQRQEMAAIAAQHGITWGAYDWNFA